MYVNFWLMDGDGEGGNESTSHILWMVEKILNDSEL